MRILFVSHEASATGAPIFLLNFARWLRHNVPNIQISTLIVKDGVFLEQWQAVGDIALIEGMRGQALIERIQAFCAGGFDLVYFNTIETSHLLSLFVEHGWFNMRCRSVLHAHELEGTVQKYGAHHVKRISAHADRVIGVSEPVRANLARNHGFDRDRIEVVHPCARDFHGSHVGERIKNRPMVLGCGEVAVVKGADLFVQVCSRVMALRRQMPTIHFEWLGIDSHGILPYLRNDTRKLGVDDVLTFAGHQDEVSGWFGRADIFFSSSREDSCPLVCLEAASLGLPIVYFERSGGMDEVLGDEAGFPVPYMDIEAAAQTIMHLIDHPEEGVRRGRRARELYLRGHQPDVVYGRLFQKVSELLEPVKISEDA